ncbi:MAG: YceH family protein, partial [Fimbriiglobus sp.]
MPDPTSPPVPPGPPPAWEPLSPHERRVLGVLIEKQKTSKSADAYPMSLNSITTGCNQKSNRDPVTEFDEDDVDETLGTLQKKGLAARITGSRVERFRHLLYEVWKPTKVEMAVLAELLLRGPQSEGDLRGRAGRMDEIKDLEELRGLVKALAERRLVVYLSEPGRRGTVVTHGFHAPAELDRARAQFAGGAADPDANPAPGSARSGGG